MSDLLDVLPVFILIAIFVLISALVKNKILGRIILFIGVSAVLAAIIIPNFIRYGPGKIPQREPKVNLSSLFTSQVTCFGLEDTYASSLEQLGWVPVGWEKKWWPPGYWLLSPEGEVSYSYTMLEADSTHFIARAEGNTDSDPTPDVWEIDHTRKVTNVVNDVTQ